MDKFKITFNQRDVITKHISYASQVSKRSVYKKRACICTVINSIRNMHNIPQKMEQFNSILSEVFVVYVLTFSADDVIEKLSNNNTLILCLEDKEDTITKCRNVYLNFVIANKDLFDIMIVVDADRSLYNDIKPIYFTCLSNENIHKWNAVFANQSYKYYDIESLNGSIFNKDLSSLDEEEKKEMIKKYQQHIPDDCGLIPVRSAFGGLAIYKTSILHESIKYRSDGHKSFNMELSKDVPKMYIDSSLILESSELNNDCYY